MLATRAAIRVASKRSAAIAAPARSRKCSFIFPHCPELAPKLTPRCASSVSVATRPAVAQLPKAALRAPIQRSALAQSLRFTGEHLEWTDSQKFTCANRINAPAPRAGYATESGKFNRSLPHMNIGTIGHVSFDLSNSGRSVCAKSGN